MSFFESLEDCRFTVEDFVKARAFFWLDWMRLIAINASILHLAVVPDFEYSCGKLLLWGFSGFIGGYNETTPG